MQTSYDIDLALAHRLALVFEIGELLDVLPPSDDSTTLEALAALAEEGAGVVELTLYLLRVSHTRRSLHLTPH